MAGEARRDDQIKAVWFAAGTAALMACIERATVVSLFAHWRVWAFLLLNLLLLPILFTSKSQTSNSNHSTDTQYGNADPELDKKKKMQPWQPHVSANIIARVQCVENETNIKCDEDGKVLEEAQFEFSKEELNQRVENFIAMFRQHLVSDSKSSCVNPKQHQAD
ncbi:uncharacterized protein [Primulina eburnea]|uniref:uncharacterized protein n=1 Tax=Primulina eburnea TaxID=1245227 RepID=UPI003C6BF425